jgi:hypothetical protein
VSEELTGTIDVRRTGTGSKSEMVSVVLLADDPGRADAVILRRRHAQALDVEPDLAAYVGKHVCVRGTQEWATFVVDGIEET